MEHITSKINILIVNFNTQNLIDACIKSINCHVNNAIIYVFDNSNKEPFKNTFDNVKVLDNTKGQIINFDKWLNGFSKKIQCQIIMEVLNIAILFRNLWTILMIIS